MVKICLDLENLTTLFFFKKKKVASIIGCAF